MRNRNPEARELREIIPGCLNMSSELERMGDHCVSIAKLARNLADLPPLETYVDVPRWPPTAATRYAHPGRRGLPRRPPGPPHCRGG